MVQGTDSTISIQGAVDVYLPMNDIIPMHKYMLDVMWASAKAYSHWTQSQTNSNEEKKIEADLTYTYQLAIIKQLFRNNKLVINYKNDNVEKRHT